MTTPRWIFASALGALALAACTTTPMRNAALDDAHRVVEQAVASGETNRHAQPELVRARDALARADRAWLDRGDNDETMHLAYLAAQDARIAMTLASQRAADARIETASAERERLRADIRTHQAQVAQQSAQAAQQSAQAAQVQAESARA